jgi:hypothetical protein
VRLEGLGQFKNPMASSGIELAAFQIVAQCLNQLRYCVPHVSDNVKIFWFTLFFLLLTYCGIFAQGKNGGTTETAAASKQLFEHARC